MKKQSKNHYTLIITGPTASGKTDLSLRIAEEFLAKTGRNSQIINADIGQFYTPLAVGTAKPDWQNMPVKHHLFDLIDEPKDLNVVQYRTMIADLVKKISDEGDLPIIVGGSLFYIRSLFFPPIEESPPKDPAEVVPLGAEERQKLWEELHEIDPVRAEALHPNDAYRVQRAIDIWKSTGKKPSEQQPLYEPPFSARILFLDFDRDFLYNRINLRTEIMIGKEGWLNETRKMKNTEWEPFLKRKKLIGYPEIIEWIENGEQEGQIPDLIREIQKKTRHYAKRQIAFWKKFRNLLSETPAKSSSFCETKTVNRVDNEEIKAILEHVINDLKRIS